MNLINLLTTYCVLLSHFDLSCLVLVALLIVVAVSQKKEMKVFFCCCCCCWNGVEKRKILNLSWREVFFRTTLVECTEKRNLSV